MPLRILITAATFLIAMAPSAAEPVKITGGLVDGTTLTEPGVHLFKGIPFAAPPVAERRWQPPAPVEPWDGVLTADTWGTHCMQGEMFGGPLTTRDESMGEDCLYLNVWTPTTDPDAALPVFVVFHGGGFAAGSGSEARTDGAWFAERGIVVVEPNYRLGVFGFMAHPELSAESGGHGSGNYGMLDQVAALEWVRDNVAAFGGDPDKVTINGESAGSMSVSAHMVSPLAKHLVHKAIGQSGAFFPRPSDSDLEARPLNEKERDGVQFAKSVGAETLADLRAMPAHELLAAVMAQNGGWGYGPGIDGHFLERPVADSYADGEQANIPLIAGWTSSELGMTIALNPEKPTVASFKKELRKTFGARADDALLLYPSGDQAELNQSAADLASDLFISFATWKWIETHSATSSAPVYRYRFDRTIPGDAASVFGAIHANDIEYSFNTLDSKQAGWQPADYAVAEAMASAFANFILTGDPNGEGVPEWPEFGETGQVMYFDTESKSGPEEARTRYELLDVLAVPASLHDSGNRDAIVEAMTEAEVPGVAAAIVNGDIVDFLALGSASPDTDIPVTPDTVFEAASLSKTVFATMYLDAVASQQLSLDVPLATTSAAKRVTDAALYRALTPQLILSHQSGLPNWAGDARIPDRTDPLEFKREPGVEFGYSGEGYELLRAHVEERLDTSLEAWLDHYRQGFGMTESHFAYAEVPANSAVAKGTSEKTTRGISASPYGVAAASLTTTARDYGRFIRYLLANPALLESLTEAQVTIEADDRGTLRWGLGWGLYERPDGSRVAFHWGDNWQFKSFVAIDLDNEVGIVYFANGIGGLKLVSAIVEPVVGDLAMVRDWLGYEDD